MSRIFLEHVSCTLEHTIARSTCHPWISPLALAMGAPDSAGIVETTPAQEKSAQRTRKAAGHGAVFCRSSLVIFDMVVSSSSWGYPKLAGWFISWKSIYKWMMLIGVPHFNWIWKNSGNEWSKQPNEHFTQKIWILPMHHGNECVKKLGG